MPVHPWKMQLCGDTAFCSAGSRKAPTLFKCMPCVATTTLPISSGLRWCGEGTARFVPYPDFSPAPARRSSRPGSCPRTRPARATGFRRQRPTASVRRVTPDRSGDARKEAGHLRGRRVEASRHILEAIGQVLPWFRGKKSKPQVADLARARRALRSRRVLRGLSPRPQPSSFAPQAAWHGRR
jgi:hypothetical protein